MQQYFGIKRAGLLLNMIAAFLSCGHPESNFLKISMLTFKARKLEVGSDQ
jgi:hypothetical protein